MISLRRPNLEAEDTFRTCISRIRDPDLEQRLASVVEHISLASDELDLLTPENGLHQIARDQPPATVTSKELEDVYTIRMAGKRAPGRIAYDEILNAAPQGRCPLCGHGTVSTLDHHLPKGRYPKLTVTPLNLIPACSDCNKAKAEFFPTHSGEETLHPYYDNVQLDRWLYAALVEGAPPAIQFHVSAPQNWSNILAARVLHHFRILGLGRLYSAQAADEILNIRHQLHSIFLAGGAEAVQLELEVRAASCREFRLNGWRTATFDALAQSTWFCKGGFEH